MPYSIIERTVRGIRRDPLTAPRKLKALLRNSIIAAVDANAVTNDTRSAFMDRANQTLVAVMIASALTGIFFVMSQFR
jgi:hypothetical protein